MTLFFEKWYNAKNRLKLNPLTILRQFMASLTVSVTSVVRINAICSYLTAAEKHLDAFYQKTPTLTSVDV